MNTHEIASLLRRRCRGTFLGVYPRDRLPDRLPATRPLLMVCNTDTHEKPGSHWIAIYIRINSTGEYFDSVNQPPVLTFTHYLDKHCSNWIKNSRQIQSTVRIFVDNIAYFMYSLKV